MSSHEVTVGMVSYGAVAAVLLPAIAMFRHTTAGVASLIALAFVFPGALIPLVVTHFSDRWGARLLKFHLIACGALAIAAIIAVVAAGIPPEFPRGRREAEQGRNADRWRSRMEVT